MSSQVDWLRAAIDLLHARSAVAVWVVGLAVEPLAPSTGAEGVVLVGPGVAELTVKVEQQWSDHLFCRREEGRGRSSIAFVLTC